MFYTALLTTAFAGHKKHDGGLSVTSKGEPSYDCPQGFNLQGKKCVKYREESLIPVCQEGLLQQGNDDICLLTQAPRQICPDGYSYDEVSCLSWDTVNPLTKCPHGYQMVSDKKKSVYCEKAIKVDGPLVCPQGTVDDGKACVAYNYINPSWSCPMGTVQDGHFCASYEEYDCSEPVFPSSHKKKDGHKLRRLGHKKDHHTVVGSGKERLETVVEINRRCKRTNYSQAIAECPPGTFTDGKQCKTMEYFERRPTKPIMTFETADVDTYCPDQFDWCPEGKKSFGGKKHSQCCQVHTKQPSWQCDMGFKLEGDRCVAYRSPTYICKTSGYKKDHKKGNCSQFEYREPLITYKVAYTCTGKDCGMDKKH